jgi:hypothetical protein
MIKSSNPRNQIRRAKLKGMTIEELVAFEAEKALKISQGYRWCNSCKEWKEGESFGKAHSYCKQCCRDRSNANYDLDKQRTYILKKIFGIAPEEYNRMLIEQKFCCYICHTPQEELDRSLAVDHDHKTGKVRGLLCGNCNRFLGQIDDSIETVERMLEYLKTHKNI